MSLWVADISPTAAVEGESIQPCLVFWSRRTADVWFGQAVIPEIFGREGRRAFSCAAVVAAEDQSLLLTLSFNIAARKTTLQQRVVVAGLSGAVVKSCDGGGGYVKRESENGVRCRKLKSVVAWAVCLFIRSRVSCRQDRTWCLPR